MTPEQVMAIVNNRGDARRELESLVPNYFSDVNAPPEMAIERALRDIDRLLDEVERHREAEYEWENHRCEL